MHVVITAAAIIAVGLVLLGAWAAAQAINRVHL
jgi:hypothetical protein